MTAFPKGSNPGNYALGKYAANMEGISVVRARREIDFRRFGFYNAINEPQHRWWGCEIIFDPELDELFGVANNKQYVELKKVDGADLDLDENDVPPIWAQLKDTIIQTIKAMYARNEETRNNTRSYDDTVSPSTNIINTVEKDLATDLDDDVTEKEVIEKCKKEMENSGYENPTDEQAATFINNSVKFVYADKGERSPAFDYKSVFNLTEITINTTHNFYKTFLSKIYPNPEVQTTFELFLASILLSVAETETNDSNQHAANLALMNEWYNRLNKYISEQLNPRNIQ